MEPLLTPKVKSLAVYFGISAPFLAIIGIDLDLLLIWVILMLIDTFLGWVISFWLSEFRSRIATERFARKGVQVIVVGALGFVGTYYTQINFLAHTMMMTFALAELVSIVRHSYTIYAKEKLPEVDVIKVILKGLIATLEKNILAKNNVRNK